MPKSGFGARVPGCQGASQEAARRVSLSKDFMPPADGYSGNPVRILGSASTGHLHFDTMSDPVPNSHASFTERFVSLSLSCVPNVSRDGRYG